MRLAPRCGGRSSREGVKVVQRTRRRGIFEDRHRPNCEHLAITQKVAPRGVRCVKGEYPHRINEIRDVE